MGIIYQSSGVDKGGAGSRAPPNPPEKNKHRPTFKLYEICQFGQFILGKIIKTVATGSRLLKLK